MKENVWLCVFAALDGDLECSQNTETLCLGKIAERLFEVSSSVTLNLSL